ncbi:MAG: membrane dipeptidase [Vicinamibacterales bacterium]
MHRREFLISTGAAALAAAGCVHQTRSAGATGAEGWRGYAKGFVIDALGSPIQFNIPQEGLPLRPAVHEAVRASGITAVNLTVNAPPTRDVSAYDATKARIGAWLREVGDHPEVFTLVRTTADISRAKADARLGIILGFQDGLPIEEDLATIGEFHALGVRVIQLTYNVGNKLGAGSLVSNDTGLTALGKEAVAALDHAGIVIDLSHCGARTTRDGVAASSRPVSITHSGCSAIFAHPRNKDDATLRALADRGGVFGIYFMPFLSQSGAPTAEQVVAHVEHALRVCGEDHVGIGTDQGIVPLDVSGDFAARFQQVSAQRSTAGIAAPREDTIPYVPELNTPRKMELLAGRLRARGHSGRVIEKVLGGNWMRLFEDIWRAPFTRR